MHFPNFPPRRKFFHTLMRIVRIPWTVYTDACTPKGDKHETNWILHEFCVVSTTKTDVQTSIINYYKWSAAPEEFHINLFDFGLIAERSARVLQL